MSMASVAVALLAAFMAADAGAEDVSPETAVRETVVQSVENHAAENAAEAPARPAVPAHDVGKLAETVAAWLGKYDAANGFHSERDGDDVYLRGVAGVFPALFSRYVLTVHLSASRSEAYCYGFLPTHVSGEMRRDVLEFIFRAEEAYGESPATLVLEDDGSVRCQSWIPFGEIERTPEKAMARLVGSVLDKLLACSRAIGRTLLGEDSDGDAESVSPPGLFSEIYESDVETLAADTDVVLKACYGGEEYEDKGGKTEEWMSSRFGGAAETDANFILSKITDLGRDAGCVWDELEYGIAVSAGSATCVCRAPIAVPLGRIDAVADAAMRINETQCTAFLSVDFDSGRVCARYSLPVSALGADGEGGKPNIYRMFAKTVAPIVVAKNAETLLAAVRDDGDGDGDSVAIPMEDAEELVKSIGEGTASGGRPLPESREPLAFRFARADAAFVGMRLGLPQREAPQFPELEPVGTQDLPALDFAERFEESVRGRLAVFPEGEMRWTEDGENGLSLVETRARVAEAQAAAVKETMKGFETANDDGTAWVIDDDFAFAFGKGLDEDRPDRVLYLFIVRRQLGEAPPGMGLISDFAPSKAMSDSILAAFRGDAAARRNLLLLKNAGIVRGVVGVVD